MSKKIVILIPVYNDGESLNLLLEKLAVAIGSLPASEFSVLVVDDGSNDILPLHRTSTLPVQVLHLHRNTGHQKAIAIGLAYIHENIEVGRVLIMDGDGEDNPADAIRLLYRSDSEPGNIIFARRTSRQEGRRFRFFYSIYKMLFRLLTGKYIAFGNFMVIPKPLLDKAVYYSEIWNHVAGGILKTGLPYTAIPADRDKRYAGVSKMNFSSLLLHGLGAIAVFVEVIATRLLIFSLLLIGISVLTILFLVSIRTFTDWAIPGWTSTVISAMLIILLQSFLLSLFTIFLYLSSQSQRKFIPAIHYKDYTGSLETVS
ncbi:MAG: glycosyltransferase family 2 protein [Chitinophagaceae bacterium]